MRETELCNAMLQEMAVITKTTIGPLMLSMYLREFEKAGFNKIIPALEKCFLDLRKFPTCKEILENAGMKEPDQKDEANIIMGRIIEATGKIGSYRKQVAEEYIGEIGWEAIKRFGGWDALCMVEEEEMQIVRAQLRDMIKAVSSFASVGRLNEKIQLPEFTQEILKIASGKIQ